MGLAGVLCGAGCGGASSVDTTKPLEVNKEEAEKQNRAMQDFYKVDPSKNAPAKNAPTIKKS